jgi:hypothetical protein
MAMEFSLINNSGVIASLADTKHLFSTRQNFALTRIAFWHTPLAGSMA